MTVAMTLAVAAGENPADAAGRPVLGSIAPVDVPGQQ